MGVLALFFGGNSLKARIGRPPVKPRLAGGTLVPCGQAHVAKATNACSGASRGPTGYAAVSGPSPASAGALGGASSVAHRVVLEGLAHHLEVLLHLRQLRKAGLELLVHHLGLVQLGVEAV